MLHSGPSTAEQDFSDVVGRVVDEDAEQVQEQEHQSRIPSRKSRSARLARWLSRAPIAKNIRIEKKQMQLFTNQGAGLSPKNLASFFYDWRLGPAEFAQPAPFVIMNHFQFLHDVSFSLSFLLSFCLV